MLPLKSPDSLTADTPLVTRQEIADRYGVCVRTVDTWRRRKLLPEVRMPGGRLVRFPLEACDKRILGKPLEFAQSEPNIGGRDTTGHACSAQPR